MTMLKTAWDDVSKTTIVNCFRKSGISEDFWKAAVDDDDDPLKNIGGPNGVGRLVQCDQRMNATCCFFA